MRFYENRELVATLNNDEAIEHCVACPFSYHNSEWTHTCVLGLESWVLEEKFANEDDNQLECWLSYPPFFPGEYKHGY